MTPPVRMILHCCIRRNNLDHLRTGCTRRNRTHMWHMVSTIPPAVLCIRPNNEEDQAAGTRQVKTICIIPSTNNNSTCRRRNIPLPRRHKWQPRPEEEDLLDQECTVQCTLECRPRQEEESHQTWFGEGRVEGV